MTDSSTDNDEVGDLSEPVIKGVAYDAAPELLE